MTHNDIIFVIERVHDSNVFDDTSFRDSYRLRAALSQKTLFRKVLAILTFRESTVVSLSRQSQNHSYFLIILDYHGVLG